MAEIGPGKLCILNCFAEPMTISVNGAVAGNIAEWGDGGAAGRFALASLAVPRAINAAPGVFFNGGNLLRVDWLGEVFTIFLPIDGARYPLIEDLALLILRCGYTLVDAFGALISSGPLTAVKEIGRAGEGGCNGQS